MILASSLNEKTYQRADAKKPYVGIIAFGRYEIMTEDSGYFVTITKNSVNDDLIDCDCTAGMFGNGCYHAAAAYPLHKRIVDGTRQRKLLASIMDPEYLRQAE
jgi:hypothetical protein